MFVRQAKKSDWPRIAALASQHNLDYEGMAADQFWVAVEGKRIVGICGLRQHADCQELCSLGVEESFQHKGLGSQLVRRLIEETPGDIYLATIIPEFFKRLGFKEAVSIPSSMIKKADWCLGCRRDRCTILMRPGE
ncbi:MAG: GNAT family N-acetyltransferase [Candidatus Aminicenantales bacterium]